MTTSAPDPRDTGHRSRSRSPVRRRPVTVFLVLALGLGWAALTVPALTGAPMEPFLLFVNLVLVLNALLFAIVAIHRAATGQTFTYPLTIGRN